MTYAERPIAEFLDRVASEQATPAGGTALAVAGATGAALVEMACIHADVAADDGDGPLAEERTALADRRAQLLELGDRDADVVDELFGSNQPSPGDPAVRRAVTVPLGIGQAALEVLELGEQVFETVTTDVVADARAGMHLAHAVVQATSYMAGENLSLCEDEEFAADVESQLEELDRAAARVADGWSAGSAA